MTPATGAKSLQNELLTIATLDEKIRFLEARKKGVLPAFLHELSPEKKFLFLLLQELQQAHLFEGSYTASQVAKFGDFLEELESFYKPIGGLLGYHILVLELIERERVQAPTLEVSELLPPSLFDLRLPSKARQEIVLEGLCELPKMAELYPVGGAGDRMNLHDEKEGRPLPVACLAFLGRSLLEHLIRDLEGREYLYAKLFHKKIITPVALMTSDEKMNDHEIQVILEKNSWFQRGRENFFRFVQPAVPVITVDGKWAAQKPFEPICKPGGHGVIWKLAIDSGAFDWLEAKGREALIVRQINNPLAGLDYNLLAHFGYGRHFKRAFGFFSCPRKPGAQEGMNVVKKMAGRSSLTNVEYTEFAKIAHVTLQEAFPANTNILFADLKKIREGVKKIPIPGALINMKSSFKDQAGKETVGVRLESTMQNIGEAFDESCTYLLLNSREKTISVAKKSYGGTGSKEGTPEGAFEDLLAANRALLEEECGFQVEGESPHFLYHPKLGPLYSVICQKLQRGVLHKGAELQIEAGEVSIHDLDLAGSLLIQADDEAFVHLHQVKVRNLGIDREAKSCRWKNEIVRKEALRIVLKGRSAFFAEHVELDGSREIVVPDGMQATATRGRDGKVEIHLRPLERAMGWEYRLGEGGGIELVEKM